MANRHPLGWGPLRSAADTPAAGQQRWAAALAHAQALLAGSGLSTHWAGSQRFVLLHTGFELGAGFLAAWAAWRADASRCARLVVVAVVADALSRPLLQQAHAGIAADSALRPLADALAAQWPAATPDLHLLDFDGGQVRLMLAFGDAARVLPELVLQADAIWLHSAPPPSLPDAGWDAHRLRHLQRMAAPGCTLASTALATPLRQALSAAGFVLRPNDTDAGANAPSALTLGHFAPRHRSQPPPGRQAQPGVRSVAVVGAGLAGAAVANALARQGLQVTVLEREGAPAQQTSGNAGGLFHSVVHAQDGTHARWLRACALQAERVLRPLLASGQVAGAVCGLLRGEQQLDSLAMQALLEALALPAEHVQVRDAALPGRGSSGASGRVSDLIPAWFYPGGGWVAPAALVAHWLAAPGITLRCDIKVQRLVQHGRGWQLLDDGGSPLQQVDAVVLCNAHDAQRLLGEPGWPLRRVRGQTTLLRADTPGLSAAELPLAQPLADGGYALRLADGRLLCGAVSQPDDDEPALRDADHAVHLATLRRLTGWRGTVDPATLSGRVGWRLVCDDRLPLLGPVPAAATATGKPPGQCRQVPRQPGLWLFTALGSRGITQAALGGELLAAWLTGAPCPAASALLDALDPARFIVRQSRAADRAQALADGA